MRFIGALLVLALGSSLLFAAVPCPYCGFKNLNEDKYCVNCTKQIRTTPPPEPRGRARQPERKIASPSAGYDVALKADGYVVYEGKRIPLKSASASWWTRKRALHVFVYPFAFTPKEVGEILEGDKNDLLSADKIYKRPSPNPSLWSWPPYLWITFDMKQGAVAPFDKSAIREYSFAFCGFEKKGTTTGTGEWVKDYTTIESFRSEGMATGDAIEFKLKSKAGEPFNWDMVLSVHTVVTESTDF